MPPRALVAPDSFKGTYDAPAVAAALARGLERAGWEADRCPVADGGEGTMALLVEALGGELVGGAGAAIRSGARSSAAFGLVDGGATAIVETAQASGLGLVAAGERDAWRASTRGTGELIVAAVAAGAREIWVAVGGSATTDGGAGAIAAIREGGGLRGARLVVLCDVESAFEDAPRRVRSAEGRLAGDGGAAGGAVGGVRRDAAARSARHALRRLRGRAVGRAVGGVRRRAAARARRRCSTRSGFDARLAAAQLLVVGEGGLDEQSFGGKIVGELVRRAAAAGVPVCAVRRGEPARRREAAAAAGLAEVREASTLEEIEAAGRALSRPRSRAAAAALALRSPPT